MANPAANDAEIKTGRIEDAMKRYNLGKNYMRKIAQEANAVVRYGRCYLINFTIMDEYMDKLTANN